MKLADLPRAAAAARLRDAGIYLRTGPFLMRLSTGAPGLAEHLQLLSGEFPIEEPPAIADFHVRLTTSGGWRKYWRTQAILSIDGNLPFVPSPVSMGLALLEWALNRCVGFQGHHFLVVHSAVVERGGHAVILPGVPGAGKSTLCAALIHRGWRLLSDEFALFRLDDGRLLPMPRAVNLKNQSIDLIQRFAPDAVMGPLCKDTHKGTVAHMRPPAESVRRAEEPASPAWVVFPAYRAGAAASLQPVAKPDALLRLADNCFNHGLRGAQGFEILSGVIDGCECYDFTYGDLDGAIEAFDGLKAPARPLPATPPAPRATAPPLTAPRPGPARLPAGPDRSLLLSVFRQPEVVASLDIAQWDRLLSEARQATLLGRLAARLARGGLLERIPAPAAAQLSGALAFGAHQRQMARWEVNRIRRALVGTGAVVTLLKGTAYVMADLPAAEGRLFSDVDFMVPKAQLAAVEAALLRHGWTSGKLDPYDQRYYRTWMHELPPLHHPERHTTIDVHHNILPESSRLHPDPRKLLEAARPAGDGHVMVLGPADMVLHTAVHLFQDGEIHGGFQDLLDIDDLVRHFSAAAGFWDALVARGEELGLTRPLFYALRYAARFLGTPGPPRPLAPPPRWLLGVMDGLVARALLPADGARQPFTGGVARWLLYVRSHWLRMPPHLLARHLTHQAFRRLRKKEEETEEA